MSAATDAPPGVATPAGPNHGLRIFLLWLPVAACSANPTSVFAGSGDTVAIHVNASDPDNDPLTYSYTATGGSVDGSGPDARSRSRAPLAMLTSPAQGSRRRSCTPP